MGTNFDNTTFYEKNKKSEEEIRAIMDEVYQAMEAKGYKPVSQLVGYLMSGDPTYITSYNDARAKICRVERDALLEALLKNYLEIK